LSISGTLLATSVRFGTSSAALTSLQQQSILVNGLGGFALDDSGFLVSAIPEPSYFAFVADFAVPSLAAVRRRRPVRAGLAADVIGRVGSIAAFGLWPSRLTTPSPTSSTWACSSARVRCRRRSRRVFF
jgi:hypothetical protein